MRHYKNPDSKGKLLDLDEAINNLPKKIKTKLEESKESNRLLLSVKNAIVIPFPSKRRVARPTLYYRLSPANYGLVFAESERAEEISEMHSALQSSKTWGELKSKLDPEEYERIVSARFDDNDEPRPESSEPFDRDEVPGYCDGDYPDWLQQEMDFCLPEEILEKYATDEVTSLNGNYYHIEEEHEEAICRDLRAMGFKVIKREDLYFY